MNRLNFVSPMNAAEGDPDPTLDDLLQGLGINPPPADPPPADPPPADPPPGDPPPADPPADPPKDPPADPPPKPDKSQQQAAAFAQLRTQNKDYLNLINGVASILGIKDTSNPESVMTKVNELVTQAKAKEAGVPEEVFKRLQTLEARDQEYTQNQLRQQAYLGFQKVKDTYKLDDAQLQQFATDISAAGNNPFEKPVDLLREYRLMNFETILAAERAAGAQAEAERAAKAAAHSSNPGKNSGPGGNPNPEKIDSVAQLTEWFNKQVK